MSSRTIPEDSFGDFLGFDSDSVASMYNSNYPLYERYVDVENTSVKRPTNSRDGKGYNIQIPGKYWITETTWA